MHKIFKNVFQKLGLSFLYTYTYGRFEPKLRRINVRKLKFSSLLIQRLDYISIQCIVLMGFQMSGRFTIDCKFLS